MLNSPDDPLLSRGEHCSPAKILKKTFPLSYFCVTKSTKSHLRGFSILLKIFFRVHELVVRSSAWQVRAAKDRAKVGSFTASRNLILPRVRTYHTRKPSRFVHASLHARIIGLAGVDGVSTLTEVTISLLQREKVARFTAADEVLPCVYCQKTYFAMFAHRHAPNLNAPVSATPTHTLRVCVNSPQEKANKNHCPPICARRILRAAEFT